VELAVGMFFVIWVLFGVGAVLAVVWTRPEQVHGRALFIASAFVGLFYAHHSSVRSDYQHLAPGLPPPLPGLVARPQTFGWSWRSAGVVGAAGVLAGLSFLAACPYNFPVQFYRRTHPEWKYVRYPIAGERLRIPTWEVGAIQLMRAVVDRHLAPGERF